MVATIINAAKGIRKLEEKNIATLQKEMFIHVIIQSVINPMSNPTKTNSEQRSEEWLQIRKIIRNIDYRGGSSGASDEAADRIVELFAQQQSILLENIRKIIRSYEKKCADKVEYFNVPEVGEARAAFLRERNLLQSGRQFACGEIIDLLQSKEMAEQDLFFSGKLGDWDK